MRGDLYPVGNPVVYTPDPDEYGGLARAVCRRALELTGAKRAHGFALLDALDATENAADEWLLTVGPPKAEAPDDDWDDDTDWKEAKW